MKDIKILIATHKEYDMPNDTIYLPIQVGAKAKASLGILRDDENDNISDKNPYYSELTGLYWAWKNLSAEYIGLVHYRRYFKGKSSFVVNGKKKKILSNEEINKLLEDVDVVLPKKRNYFIETLYSHYEHTMYIEPLDETGKIISEKYPKYLEEFNNLKKRKSAHMFNMFVMKKSVLDKYCEWLFSILFELERRVDTSIYDSFHARFFGRISELLLDVWIRTNMIKYKEVKINHIERTNWIKKGIAFLKAKIKKEKYRSSF